MLNLFNCYNSFSVLMCETLYPFRIHVSNLKNISNRRKLFIGEGIIENSQHVKPILTHNHFSNFCNDRKDPITCMKNKKLVSKELLQYKNMESSETTWNTAKPSTTEDCHFTTSDEPHCHWKKNLEEVAGLNFMRKADHCNSQIPKNFRSWDVIKKKSGKQGGKTLRFKVLSYNVLAQYLLECHPYLYAQCAPRNLKWVTRAFLLYEEIKVYAPDIICLQEVQASHLTTFFSKFEELGYYGVFKQKTGHRHDGCAIYFKKNVFTLLERSSVEFYQPDLPILNRDNIGIMLKLAPKAAPDSHFVVATTHLLYNPKRTDVRLAQVQVFLAEIDRFSYYNTGRETGHLPIVMTGDLNSTPDSAVIQLLERGFVRCVGPYRDNSDWKKIGVTDNCQHLSVYLSRQKGEPKPATFMTKIRNSDNTVDLDPDGKKAAELDHEEYSTLFNSGVIGHQLRLKSAYPKTRKNGDHEATTYQESWVTVDYIYYSSHDNLALLERLRLPTVDECKVLKQLPNNVYGSDHLALGAVFEMKAVKSNL